MINIIFIVCVAMAGGCALLFIIQLAYIFGLYNGAYRKQHQEVATDAQTELPPLSVIIVTKDSGEALNRNLPLILEQDYPQFEVIVVNDKSAGEDEDILKRLSEQYPNLYHTFIPETARYVSRKKLGIAMGIRASKYEWVVVTEPYCYPVSKNWLKSLAKEMTPETDIVLGYSNYEKSRGSFARKITTDTFFHTLRFLCMALAGQPYMGIGRNLAYRKSIYLSHKGFADHLPLKRGEDDLFVNAVATKENTRVAVSADSIVRMPVPPFKHIWHDEKMSLTATGRYYQGSAKLWNGIEAGSNMLFHLLTLATLAVSLLYAQWIVAGAVVLLWIVRLVCQFIVFKHAASVFGESLNGILLLLDWLRAKWNIGYKTAYLFSEKSDFFRK